MKNTVRYKDTWSAYRQAVSKAAEERDKELSRLQGYKGERAEKERQKAREAFSRAVGVAREAARAEFNVAIGGMRKAAEAVGSVMEPPSEEALRTLQMLSLRTSISPAEAEAAAKSMQGNDACLTTLQELCVSRGGARVSAKGKSKRGQAFDALREFEDAAKMCLAWQGGTRGELMRERNAQHLAQVPESERVPIGAAIAADVEAGRMSHAEFVRSIVGNTATVEGAAMLD